MPFLGLTFSLYFPSDQDQPFRGLLCCFGDNRRLVVPRLPAAPDQLRKLPQELRLRQGVRAHEEGRRFHRNSRRVKCFHRTDAECEVVLRSEIKMLRKA